MRLKIATILVIIGSVATFLSRITGTLSPKLLQNVLILKTFGIVSLLSFLAIVAFFVIFLIDFARKKQLVLKIASILMIIGSLAIFILFLKAVLTLFNIVPSIYYYARPGLLEAVVPFVTSIFIVFFFAAFYKAMVATMSFPLKLAVLLVIASSFTNLVLKIFVLSNYFSSGGFNWFISLFGKFPIVIVLISLFWFLTNLYFYMMFYFELKN